MRFVALAFAALAAFLAVALAAGDSSAAGRVSLAELDERFPHRFPATPLLTLAEAEARGLVARAARAAFLERAFALRGESAAGQPEGLPKGAEFNKARNSIIRPATKVVRIGSGKSAAEAGAADGLSAGDIDGKALLAGAISKDALSKVHRECPRRVCKAEDYCSLPSGVCCGNGKHCCPQGSTCLNTDPPTCVHDTEEEENRCAEEECLYGHKCPHDGVATCCLGGRSCCPRDHKCRATNPPSCEKMLNEQERRDHEAMEAKLLADKKAKEDAERKARDKEFEERHKVAAKKHDEEISKQAAKHAAQMQREVQQHQGELSTQRTEFSKEQDQKAAEAANKNQQHQAAHQRETKEAEERRAKAMQEQQKKDEERDRRERDRMSAEEKARKEVEAERNEAQRRIDEQRAKANELAGNCDCIHHRAVFQGYHRWINCPDNYLMHGMWRDNHPLTNGIHWYHCCRVCRHDGTRLTLHGCHAANWVHSFDRVGWSFCPDNYYMNGLYKSSCDHIYCIEHAHCCAVTGSRGQNSCSQTNWVHSLDHAGWSTCDANNFMRGLYRNHMYWGWGWDPVSLIEHAYQCRIHSY